MLVTRAAVPLKNRDGLGGPGDVVSFIGHLSPRIKIRRGLCSAGWLVPKADIPRGPEPARTRRCRSLNQGGSFLKTGHKRRPNLSCDGGKANAIYSSIPAEFLLTVPGTKTARLQLKAVRLIVLRLI
jgi:hypothetical protein